MFEGNDNMFYFLSCFAYARVSLVFLFTLSPLSFFRDFTHVVFRFVCQIMIFFF